MSSFRFVIATAIPLLATPAFAQTVGQASPQRQPTPVRVQTSLNFFMSGPSGDSAEAQKSRADARRSIYEMAAKECGILQEVLAKDCRLESISTNIGRQYGQKQEGYLVNASMSFQITLK